MWILTFLSHNIYSALNRYHYKYLCIGHAHLDNNVFCNKRHPEDGLMEPKHVGAWNKIHSTCAFCWFFIWWYMTMLGTEYIKLTDTRTSFTLTWASNRAVGCPGYICINLDQSYISYFWKKLPHNLHLYR